ncbi:MAG: M23 family metallopeptidase [Legionella sp.]|nr:MAG: M23 family metallopeptidase [Legionella sp.]
MNKLIYLGFILLAWSQTFWAMKLPENHSVNGGLTIIPVDVKKQPEAYFAGKRIPVLPSEKPNQWLLVVAIPINNTDSVQYLDIKKPFKARVPFQVSEKFYTTQSLTIKDLSKVDPTPEEKIRIDQEAEKLSKLFSQYSNTNPFESSFAAPLKGPISSLFGLKRIYNKQPRDPHSGLDIAAPEGKPVYAASNGVVVDTGNYFLTGNIVVLDHGMGVFSLYAHLSEITVRIGDQIKQGEEVGLVGMTGRVTGPHLHWTMVVNQTLVDPLLFVPLRKIVVALPAPAPKTKEPKS